MEKLTLSKETIRRLDEVMLGNVKGGAGATTAKCAYCSGVGTWACCFNANKPTV